MFTKDVRWKGAHIEICSLCDNEHGAGRILEMFAM